MSNSADLPPPMTDDDVAASSTRLMSLPPAMINEICDGFKNKLKQILFTIKKALDTHKDEDQIIELDRAQRLVSFLPSDEIFIRCKDKIWFAKYQILNKDASWFMEKDFSKNIKRDSKQVMIETLFSAGRSKYTTLSDAERDLYWTQVMELLAIVAKYKKATSEP